MQALIDFFGIKDLIPHGYCLSWSPLLLWLNVISDLLITAAYYSIPLMVVYFLRQRKDFPYPWLVAMIAGFILACGTTHLLSAITIWIPLYWLDGLLKGFTAILSVATAVLMLWIIPRALSMPNTEQLQEEALQRKMAVEASQEALNKLHKIASQLPGMVFQFRLRTDGSSCFPYVSEVLRDIYRLDPEEVFDDAAKVFTVIHPDDLAEHLTSIQTSARDLSPWRDEYRLKFADGTERWLFGNALPQREEDGSVLWHGFVTDITERKQADDALRESEERLRTLYESTSDAVMLLDETGFFDCNRATLALFGCTSKEEFCLHHPAYLSPRVQSCGIDSMTLAKLHIANAIKNGSGHFDWIHKRADSEQTFYADVLLNAMQLNGKTVLQAVVRDITERKKAEEQAQASAQYARRLIEASLDPLVTINPDGKITDVNTATEQVTGVDRDDLIGSDFADYFTDPEKAREGYQQVFSQDFVFDYPLAIRHASGKVTEVLYNASLYHDDKNNVLGVFAAARDITERKLMEDELKTSEAKFRSIIDVSPVPLALNDEQSNITFVNPAFVQTFGYTVDDISTLTDWWQKAYPDPDYRNEVSVAWHAALEKAKQKQAEFAPMELSIRCKDSSIKTVLVAAAAIQENFAGEHLVILYDITPRKQIEAELTRSNADLEQFAYAVSHDMRQPLRMVTSYLSLIENALAGSLDEDTQQFLDFAVNGAKRMDAMILSLLDYSRIGRVSETKTRINSKDSLDEVLAFLSPELRACGGEIKITGDWPELDACRDELTRLLQNLIGNALKYHEENQPPKVYAHGTVRGGLFRVEVRDQGVGIEPSQMDRLFKVFSRLQARSRFEGTGVGLALCRKIVEHHGGAIGVESAGEGQGCVFWFELPIVNA